MKYARIARLFSLISADNGGCTADEIEAALMYLTDSEFEILAAGEQTDQEAVNTRLRGLTDAHTVASLNTLLEVAFQGVSLPEQMA